MGYYRSKKFTDELGKMKHIGLKEGDVAKSVLLPGDPQRSKVISECFASAEFIGRRKTFATYTGKTDNGTDISVMSSGMGSMCVTLALEELAHLGVDTVIRVGTGAGIQYPFKPGTLVIATGCVRGEGASYEYVPPEFPAVADYRVVNALHKACIELGEEPVIGLYRAHDAFYMESKAAHEGLKERMQIWQDTNVQLIENESGTLFTLGYLLGIKTCSICVALGSMFDEDNPDDAGSSAYSVYQDPDFMKKRIEKATRVAIRAIEILSNTKEEK